MNPVEEVKLLQEHEVLIGISWTISTVSNTSLNGISYVR